jgi:hypothetical protein
MFGVNIVACLINCSRKNGHLLVGRAVKNDSGSSRDKKRPGRPQPKGMWAYMPKTARDCEDNSSRGVNKVLLLVAQILQRPRSQKHNFAIYILCGIDSVKQFLGKILPSVKGHISHFRTCPLAHRHMISWKTTPPLKITRVTAKNLMCDLAVLLTE